MTRIVVAYSGAPDTAMVIPWLADTRHAEVIALTLDFGQRAELEDVRERALASGVVRAHVLDVREEFARDYVLPTLRADAVDNGAGDPCPLLPALSRPLVARKLVEIAAIEQATTVAHGGRSGRLETAILDLQPALTVLSPAHEWATIDQAQYAHDRGIPFPPAASAWPTDVTLWGRTLAHGAGSSGSPLPETLPEKAYALTKAPVACPDEAAYVELAFDRDVPTAINDVPMPLVDLIGSLTIIAGAHGVGRAETVDRRPDGSTIRAVCEAPAAILLHTAYRALRSRTGGARGGYADISRRYAELVRDGRWFSPLRAALDSSLDAFGEPVSGVVRLKLFKGQYQVHDNSMVRAF